MISSSPPGRNKSFTFTFNLYMHKDFFLPPHNNLMEGVNIKSYQSYFRQSRVVGNLSIYIQLSGYPYSCLLVARPFIYTRSFFQSFSLSSSHLSYSYLF